jgi:hypothetical protein
MVGLQKAKQNTKDLPRVLRLLGTEIRFVDLVPCGTLDYILGSVF